MGEAHSESKRLRFQADEGLCSYEIRFRAEQFSEAAVKGTIELLTEWDGYVDSLHFIKPDDIGQRLARFRQINMDNAVSHHDALEFPDGQVTLLTRLCEGQCATVLQLPITAHPAPAEESVRREVREPSLLA
jgi:hypothetical protein